MYVSNGRVLCTNSFACVLLKVPVFILRKLYIRIIVCLEDFFGGNNLKQGHCDLPVRESKIYYKLKEISSSPNKENKILGDDNRFGVDDSVTA